jgi:hypothetical protein
VPKRLGRLGYRGSVTNRKVARPAGRRLGAMLTAMPFSSDRAVPASCCDFRTIRLRQIAEDHTIGNLVADAGCPRWSRTAPGRQASLSGRYRPAGFAD